MTAESSPTITLVTVGLGELVNLCSCLFLTLINIALGCATHLVRHGAPAIPICVLLTQRQEMTLQ